MALRIERIPTLSDNYTYLVICEASGEAAVVDAPEAFARSENRFVRAFLDGLVPEDEEDEI